MGRIRTKITYMKLALSYIFILIILLIYGTYRHNQQQRYIGNVPQYAEAKEVDSRVLDRDKQRTIEIAKVQAFYTKYQSPLKDYASEIVDEAYIYGLDYKIITSIAMVESSGCKFPARGTEFNCWGFSSTTAPLGFYRFTSYNEGIQKVIETLGTSPTYKRFQQTNSIEELAVNYNLGSQDWINSMYYFINNF